MTQEFALQILKTGANVFLTGEPGSGKTHTLRAYIDYLKSHSIDPSITASTGIAATHIHGSTIHSWSGIGVKEYISNYDAEIIANKKNIFTKISKATVLVIDEVSMISSQMLDNVSRICQEVRRNKDAFGGLQVVLVGDFFQLPPVSGGTMGQAGFAFESAAWKSANFVVCYLSEQHRQADEKLLGVLSAVRSSSVEEEHMEHLRARYRKDSKKNLQNDDKKDLDDDDENDSQKENSESVKDKTRLYTHNIKVDEMNNAELSKLPGKSKTFTMTTKGKQSYVDALVRGCLSPENLVLKIGARVMCTKNNPTRRFANGTLGIVIGFGEYDGYPIIKTDAGEEILVEPMSWQVEDEGKIKAEITQVPLRLAWAITVHKSQGVTLDSAIIDLSGAFTFGQGYVALSRVRTMEGIHLVGMNSRALQVDPFIIEKDLDFKKLSREAEMVFGRLPHDELQALHKNFIVSCGGTLEINKEKPKKEKTHDITLEFIKSGTHLDDIARERNLKLDTIIDHVHVLLERGDITMHDALNLVPTHLQKELEKIYKAFDEYGSDALKPTFEYFKGRYPYSDLKLARILYTKMLE